MLFQSKLRKQNRNLPKILNFVKIIHYFSKLFTSLLTRGFEEERVGRLGAASRGKLPPSVKKEKVSFIPNSMFRFSQIYSNLLRSFDPFASATGREGTGTGAVAGSAGSQRPHGLVPVAPFWVGWRALDRF